MLEHWQWCTVHLGITIFKTSLWSAEKGSVWSFSKCDNTLEGEKRTIEYNYSNLMLLTDTTGKLKARKENPKNVKRKHKVANRLF